MKKDISVVLLSVIVVSVTGCSTLAASTNTLTDERIKADTSGVLGYKPSEVTITGRRTEGSNTYVNLLASNKKEYTCIIDGGNIFTMGMSNAPQCAKKGEPISANPLMR